MRRLLFAAALAALPAVVCADGKKGAKHPAGYTWEENYEVARLKAAASGKLLFIDFYTDW
jgi:hypothetical protein